MDQFERMPPQAVDFEQAVLGAMMISAKIIDPVCELIIGEDYYHLSHQIIHRAIVNLVATGRPVDQLTVCEELRQRGQLDQAGGVVYLSKIAAGVATGANAVFHAKIIKEKSIGRQLIVATNAFQRAAYEANEPVGGLLDRATAEIEALSSGATEHSAVSAADLIAEVMELLEERYRSGGKLVGVPTGFQEMDRITGGWKKSNLIILAASTSVGKSAMASCLSVAACSQGFPVVIFSTEMSRQEWMDRVLSAECQVPLTRLQRGLIREDEWTKITMAGGRIANFKSWWYDDAAPTPQSIERRVRMLQRQHGIGLVVIDYLGLLAAATKSDGQEEEVRKNTRALKGAAKRLNVPIICLAQLNRQPDNRADPQPKLSDLRSSGAIEQDADVVAFIYRPEMTGKEWIEENGQRVNVKGMAKIIIGKQRNGPVGEFWVEYRSEYTQFATAPDDPYYSSHDNQ